MWSLPPGIRRSSERSARGRRRIHPFWRSSLKPRAHAPHAAAPPPHAPPLALILALAFATPPCRYWDGKTATPRAVLQLPERAYCVDVRYPLMVICTAERKIVVVNLTNPQTIYATLNSPLKYQSRCVACFPDQQGFCLGSIEGRVAVHHVHDRDASKNFAFKCHRDNQVSAARRALHFLSARLKLPRPHLTQLSHSRTRSPYMTRLTSRMNLLLKESGHAPLYLHCISPVSSLFCPVSPHHIS